jgi:hypothetical protein
MLNATPEPGIADELQQAVRDAVNRIPTVLFVGLIVIGVLTMGMFSRRRK